MIKLIFYFSAILLPFALISCSSGGAGTTGGNPINPTPSPIGSGGTASVQVSYAPFASALNASAAYSLHNGLAPMAKLISNHDSRALTAMSICFKRIRFKPDESYSGTEVTLNLSEQTLNPSGGTIGQISVTAGIYRRVELDIANVCGQGRSIVFTNSNGTFSTDDHIQLRFEGQINVDMTSESALLSLNSLIEKLDSVSADGDIKNLAESAVGSY